MEEVIIAYRYAWVHTLEIDSPEKAMAVVRLLEQWWPCFSAVIWRKVYQEAS